MAATTEQFSTADSEISLEQPHTRAFMQDQDLGSGLLSIDEKEVKWEGDGRELILQYPSIILHAISRDTSSFHHECIFMLWERALEEGGDEHSTDSEEQTVTTEVRLVPPEKDQLEGIFEAICECQKLHPDPDLSDSADEEEEEEKVGGEEKAVDLEGGDFFTTPEGLEHLTPEGRAVLAHLENIVQLPTPEEFQQMVGNGADSKDNSQFEDAD